MPDILSIIGQTGIVYKKASSSKGGIYKGPCPWCGGNDRFSIYPFDNAGWYICNQCKKTGDAIQFERDYNGLRFKEACERVGDIEKAKGKKHPVQKEKRSEIWKPRIIEKPVNQWAKKAVSLLFSSFKYLMSPNGLKHREYLNLRGISNDTIKKARLGYNTTPINYEYDTFGLDPETDHKGKNRTVWIPDGIIIPYFDHVGLKRIRVRNANPFGKNRYVLVTGGTTEYFIYPGGCNSKITVVVESELDGWLVWQEAGDIVNVMAAGNSSTRPDQASFELLSSCPGVLCAFDFDDAGKKESEWWAEHFKSEYWPVPKGKDPGEAFVLGVDIRAWIQSGINKLDGVNVMSEPGPSVLIDPAYDDTPIQEDQEEPVDFEPGNKYEPRITVTHIDEISICKNGDLCIHIKNGMCLLSGEYIHYLESCPKRKWWIWSDPECDGISMLIKGY